MNNEDQSVKTKNITLGGVIGWLFGIGSVLVGVTSIFTRPLSGILFLLIAAITLPPANNFLRNKIHLNLSKGLRIVLVLVLLGIAGSTFPKSDASSPVADSFKTAVVTPSQPAIQVTAVKLAADYKANEVAADAKYKNNAVEVSGLVTTIGKDILDTPYIALSDGEEYSFTSVQCMFSKGDESQLATVSKGDRVTLKGEVSGKLGNVLLKGCSIIK
jgi:hypothetical protein